MIVYIDSTLKHEWNKKFNVEICDSLEQHGITCHLPQRDTNQTLLPQEIFHTNHNAIKNADVILAISNNESPNWGVEIGYAFAMNIPIIGLAHKGHEIPTMARFMMSDVLNVASLDEIHNYLDELINKIAQHKNSKA